jgi:hypothetical protein
MRRSNRMKRIMCEQWVHYLPAYARTEAMRFSPRVSRGTTPETSARSTGHIPPETGCLVDTSPHG